MGRFSAFKPEAVWKSEVVRDGLDGFGHFCNVARLGQQGLRPLPFAISMVIAGWRAAAAAAADERPEA